MTFALPRWIVAASVASSLVALTSARAVAELGTSVLAAGAVTISGKITDARNLPIVGAVITARGTAVGWTATRHDGSYVLSIPPGSYEFLVRKGGYTPNGTAFAVAAGAVKVLSLALTEANLTSVSPGSVKSSEAVPFNTGVAATATLSAAAITQRPAPVLRDLALELPGVSLAHSADVSPDTSFVVRGGTVETRVQIDGHAVSAGATGRWNSSYASLALFDSVEVVKGIGLSGANAGESAFGTINLRTHDFTRGRHEDVVVGVDGFGGMYSNIGLSGNAFKDDRLSYLIAHNAYGYNGPNSGRFANVVVPEANGTALIAGRSALDDRLNLGSDLVKVRWRFSGATSLTAGYIGLHSDYPQSGGAYATYLGDRTIVASAPTSFGGTIVSPPQFAALIGKTIPVYSLPQAASVKTNQPLFEAELRAAIGSDTLLVRPYVGTNFHVLNGQSVNSGDPLAGGNWSTVTTGPGCSVQRPCFRADSGNSPFRDQEEDRLHGTTASLVHPVGDATLNLSYDYRSDQTTVASGNPSVRYDGTPLSLVGYQDSIPATVARNYDWSATYAMPLTSRLEIFAGFYQMNWKLDYGSIAVIPNFRTGRIDQVTTLGERVYRHIDPHLGFTWHPQSATSLRLSAGSAVTIPYADLVAGAPTTSGLFSGGQLGLKNADLQPESTFAYNLGADHRYDNGSVISADIFYNSVHNVFATRTMPFNGAVLGIPPGSPLNALFGTISMPVNAPLEHDYGLELSLANAPPQAGVGYRLAVNLQRGRIDRLAVPAVSSKGLISEKVLTGSTSIPYTQGYGEISYRHHSGIVGSFGINYIGTNNWTNGPAFAVCSSMLRYDLRSGYRVQLSAENLLNTRTADEYASATALPFAPVGNGSPVYGATAGARFGIAPQTFRLQLEAHLGH